jgi:hypothetical protein
VKSFIAGDGTAPKLPGISVRVRRLASTRLSPLAAAGALACVSACALAVSAPASRAAATRAGWSAMAVTPLRGSGATVLTGVSCPTARFCMAVGTTQRGSGLLAERFNGSGWRPMRPHGTGLRARLAAISCLSTRWCVAVGYTGESPAGKLPLAEFWNGRSWHPQVVHTQAGLSADQWSLFEGVSCPTQTRCYAVGQAGPPQPDMEDDLLATWTQGQGWTYTMLDGTQTNVLNMSGVSCSSLDACFAVGQSAWRGATPAGEEPVYFAYQSLNGSYQWGGAGSSGSDTGVSMNAVACPGGYQCIAVGQGIDGTNASDKLASFSLNLSGATAMPIGAPNTATAASLNGIACPTSRQCTSVGDAQIGKRVRALAETWNGSAWTIRALARSRAYGSALTAVSCPSVGDCVAVGSRQLSARSKPEALIERWAGAR